MGRILLLHIQNIAHNMPSQSPVLTSLNDLTSQRLVIIDPTIEKPQHLINGVVSETRVVVLDSKRESIPQVTQALRTDVPVTELHLVSHGAPGQIQWGNGWLTLENLGQYAVELQNWRDLLGARATVFVYGCQVAAGELGQQFIQRLRQRIGATVTANKSMTGNAALGGNWDLSAGLSPALSQRLSTLLPFTTSTLATYPASLNVEPTVEPESSLARNSDTNDVLNASIVAAKELLASFAAEANFLEQLTVAFGDGIDLTAATQLQAQLSAGDFELPKIEIRTSGELAGLLGAYATATDTIYLSESFLNTGTLDQIVAVLLEEIGHGVDARINAVDSLGDEGNIFSHLVRGQELSASELQGLRAEVDHYTLMLDGQPVQVEASTVTISSDMTATGSNPINVTSSTNIVLDNNVTVSVVNGNLTMLANNGGGAAGNFAGLFTNSGSLITTSGTGNISLTGFGGDDAGTGQHAGFQNFGSISSTASGASAGTITINGTAGDGTLLNDGVQIRNSVTSVDGDIQITGQGSPNSTSFLNFGVKVQSAQVSSTGTGANAATITINGTSGGGSSDNSGVRIEGTTGRVTSVEGDILITGQGGAGGNSPGVQILNGEVASTGTGANAANITIIGTGSSGSNPGVEIDSTSGVSGQISTVDGRVTINGTGTTGNADGVRLRNDAVGIVATGSGAIDITGVGAGNGDGIDVQGGIVGGASASGAITLTTDGINIQGGSIQSSGALVIQQVTASESIGIGGGAGTLNIDAAELSRLTDGFSSITFGASNSTGTVTLGSGFTLNDPTTITGDATNGYTLQGSDTATTFTVTGTEAGSITNGGITFSGNSSLAFNNATTLQGGAGSNTIVGQNTANTWAINGNNAGTYAGISFGNIENITGGNSTDNFVFSNGATISGTLDGGAGNNTLDLSAYTSNLTFNLNSAGGNIASVVGSFAGFENFIGGSGSNTLNFDGQTSAVTLGNGTISANGTTLNFSNVESLNVTTTASVNTANLVLGSTIYTVTAPSFTLNGGSTFGVDIMGETPGTNQGQLVVIGGVNLNGATLNIDDMGFTPNGNETLVLVDNDGSDSVVGTFNGLTEGAMVTVGGQQFQLSYTGGDGNDVVLQFPNITPVASNVAIAATEDGATVNGAFSVSDTNTLDTHTFNITSSLSEGSVVNNNNGTFTFNPGSAFQNLAAGEMRDVSFTYTATDNSGESNATSASATVTVTVSGVNDAPVVAAAVTATASEDAATFNVDLLQGATDPDTTDTLNAINLTVTSGDASGVTVNGNSLQINPTAYNSLAEGESEVIVYSYNITDGNGGSVPQTATVTITGANDAPVVAAAVTATATEDTATFNVSLLAGATDPDTTDTINVSNLTVTSGDASGVTVNGNSLQVNPSAYNSLAVGESEVIVYSYVVSDGNDGNTPQTATITITGANDAPVVAAAVTATASEDAATFNVDLLAGASDPDTTDTLNAINLTVTSGDASGVTVNGNRLEVNPSAYNALAVGESEVIVYSYVVSDGNGGNIPQTATVTITGANDAPIVASAVTATASEDAATFNVDLLAGTSDPDTTDTINVSSLTVTSGNASGVTVNGNSLQINPTAYNSLAVGESEVIVYSYVVSDGNGGNTPQTATITITGANDAPVVAAAVTATASEDAATFNVDLLAGASDPDTTDTLNAINLTVTSGDASGVTVNGNRLEVNPSAYNALAVGESEVIVYSYVVSDGNGGNIPQTATVTITGANDAPIVASAVTATATEDDGTFNVDLLAGASDPDTTDTLNAINLTVTSGDASGVTVNGNRLEVNPSAYNALAVGESEVIVYSYVVSDGNGGNIPQTATVTITGANDAPIVASAVTATATEDDGTFNVDLLARASDPDTTDTINVSSLTVTSGDASGVTVNGNRLEVNPNAYNSLAVGESEVITYSYVVSDGNGGNTPQTATVTINGVYDTLVSLDSSGNLIITDAFITDNDNLSISSDGTNVTIHDPNNLLGHTIAGATGDGTNTITVPTSLITSPPILIKTNGGNDTISGSSQAENIDAGEGNDSLIGNDGNDTLIGGLGADILEGGAGDDVLIDGVSNGAINSDAIAFGRIISATTAFTLANGGWTSNDRFPRQLADVNGDGRADIVGFGYRSVVVSLGQSDGTFGTAFTATDLFSNTGGGWTSNDRFPRQLADVNGDGRADIVGFGYRSVIVSLGQSDGTFGTAFTATDLFSNTGGGWTSNDRFPRQLADVNGDGRADIVGFGYRSVAVSLGQSDGTFGTAFTATDLFSSVGGGWTSNDRLPRQLADVNGDGRADIVGFGYRSVVVSLGQSDGTFGTAFTATDLFSNTGGGWTSNDRFPRQLADMNGDGRADIVGFGYRSVVVSLGQSDGTFGTAFTATDVFTHTKGGWTSDDRYPRQLADVNGDGQADVIGFGESQVIVSLSNSVDDILIGGTGNDRLVGGAGNDILTGGADADTFAFAGLAATGGIDRITDFNANQGDIIEISQASFGVTSLSDITFNAATGELFVGGAYSDTLAILTNQVGFNINTHVTLV
ncbi:VCBS [Acaryochloris marina MBIC11017]|uniref:VCBS n=2 Tax=Acaryochloris marina TaxID=155978 RepID=B0BZ62_ACAM1|nr:VCBS [Acaryochloris marina MBIC11017]